MKLTIAQFITLDGVVQSPGGPSEDPSDGFAHGGWSAPYGDDESGKQIVDWILTADAFLLGRRTYDIFAGFWPTITDPDNPVATTLNGKPKYVVSTTLQKADWEGTTVIGENVVEEIRRLRDQPGGDLQVHGSGALARTLMRHGLIDEYRLIVCPVVLGDGEQFFERGTVPTALDLVECTSTPKGVLLQVYRPVGPPTYGNYGEQDGKVERTG